MTKSASKPTNTPNTLRKNTKTPPHRGTPADRPRTKSASVLALLMSKDGATITDISAATGWQNHSIRGFLSGTVKKKLGREVSSAVVDGKRRYRLAV
ncbi:DUF3489 domain-containing protein [Aestuariivirga sp.]|uniref:DUF3489 domain-containing protein n=1 Tax=Aestuariivirga sp. TaxID=2650926 RepID=UPI003BAA606C